MKTTPLILVSIISFGGLLLFTGCSSTPDRVDRGPIKARTFSFVHRGTPPRAEFADNREQAHALIQQDLTDNLAAKGVTKVDSGGDITVAYLVILGNNATTESINKYFGYGRDSSALHEKAHDAYTKSDNPNYFEAGTLLVDIIDSKSFELLRRAHVTRPVLRNASAEIRAANIKEAVDAVMKDLRIVN